MVDLHALTAEAFTLLRLGDNEQHVDLVNACCEGLSIKASYQPLLQVLLNLLTNAQQASAAGARIEVSSRQDGAQVRWQVTDEGCGIPASLLERVFDPFFTTKDPGQGTGLGLALVHRLVTDLGGSVRIESPPASGSNGKGTCVIVTFPCYDPGSFVTE
jgi:signal transduction histidine kinase